MVWRHGRTAWNVENRFQGHTDIALDEVGVSQAERAAALLAQLPIDRIVSSDLTRAADTARALAVLTGHEVLLDPRLRETNGGSWEGMRGPEIAAADAERYLAWRQGADVAAGGAETRSQVAQRAQASVLEHLAAVPEGGQLVVVTHGGTARSLLGHLLGLPVDLWRAIGALSNACWSVAEEGRTAWWLAEHNAGSLPTPVIGDDR